MTQPRRPAVFLDRDGTVIENVPYLGDPDRVSLFADSIPALRRLRDAGYALVIVTNQSAVGRGMITLDQVAAVNDAMTRLFAAGGVRFDAIEFCPEAPTSASKTAVEHPDRKPGPGMLLRAAANLSLDLGASWIVGDQISDALAGVNAGCRGSILLTTGHALNDDDRRGPYPVASTLSEAVDLILDMHPSPQPTSA